MNVGKIFALPRRGKTDPRPCARTSHLARPRGLRLESLEQRQMLAITSSVTGGLLTISANAADNIAVTEVGGNVLINGANPGSGAATAASITGINITATGNFANTINLSGVTAAAFANIPATGGVTVDAGPGIDAVVGSERGDSIIGGAGDDSITGGDGNDTLVDADGTDALIGGAGDDVYRITPGGNDLITDASGVADRLEIVAAAMNTVTYNYTNATDGDVQLDPDGPGGVAAHVITYTGLDPIANTGTATNVIFNLPATADTARLIDVVGMLRLESLNGTFETTDFVAPGAGGSMTINLGGGTDDLSVSAVAVGATNIINGDADNDILRVDATGLTLTFNGNAGTNDQVIGPAAPTAWTVNGANSGSIVSGPSFASVESLTGSGSPDTFNVTAAWAGSLAGGLGNDQFNLTTGSVAGIIAGDGGNDTLTGQTAANTWNINAPNAGTLNGGAFNGVETLVGGSGADDFNFSATGSLTGSLDGAGGVDELDFSGLATARNISLTASGTTVGFRGTEASSTGGFDNITRVVGTAQTDSLSNNLAPAATATWEIDGTNQFVAAGRTLDFAAIENLNGGSLADTFNVTAAHIGNLSGNAGNDVFNINGVTLTGNLTGGADNDTFNLTGGATVTGTIDGEAGQNTLTGPNAANTWNINAPNAGTLNGSAFTGVESLVGGNGADDFNFSATGSLSGTVNGGAGANDLDFSGLATARSISLTAIGTTVGFRGTEATITGGFDNITRIEGTAQTDSLSNNLSPAATATWAIDGTNQFLAATQTLNFGAIENLNGGSLADTFTVTAAHTGNLTGNAGNDIFNVTGATVTGNLAGNADNDTFNFSGIADVTGTIDGGAGGLDTMTLAGVATTVTHRFDNANDGQVDIDGRTLDYLGLDPIADNINAMNRVFTFAAATADNITLGDDPTPLNGISRISSVSSSETVDFVNPTVSLTINAGANADIITLNAIDSFGGMPRVTVNGGAGDDDIFINALPTSVNNVINGDADNDEIHLGLAGLGVTVNGGANDDTLFGPNSNTDWLVNAPNAGTVAPAALAATASFATVENLVGGSGIDDFEFTLAGMLAGFVEAGTGVVTDILDYTTYGSARNVTLTGLGANDGFNGNEVTITGGFRNINTIRGTTGSVDSLRGVNAASIWNIAPIKTHVHTTSLTTLTFVDFETLIGEANVDVFNVAGANIESGDPNTLEGNGENDTFNIALPSNGGLVGAAGTTLIINGGTQAPGGRDIVNINATADTLPRMLDFVYQSNVSADVNILGIGTNAAVDVNTVEEVNYTGDAGNDDDVDVFGTTGNDDITVHPLSASAADVFLGLAFTNGAPSGEPGINGGFTGPDMSLEGVLATGLSIDGNGFTTGDTLTVEILATTDQEINVTNVVVAPSMLIETAYDNINAALNIITQSGNDMVMIDLPDILGDADALTATTDPNGPLPDFVRVLSDAGFDIVKYIDAGADQEDSVINFSDISATAVEPPAAMLTPVETRSAQRTAFQLSQTECSVVMAGAGDDVVRNSTLANNANFSTNSVVDLGDGNDTAFGSNNGKQSFGVNELRLGDVIYGGAGMDTITAGSKGVKFIFADLDAMGVNHPMAGDVIDGSFNTQVAVSFGAGDNINNVIGGIAGTGGILNVITWLKAQWLVGDTFVNAAASKCANWGANYSGQNLGTIASQSFPNLNSLAGDQWFDFTAAAAGELTATALFAPGDHIEIKIFDAFHAPLAWNLSNDGSAVAQTEVVAGGHYFVRVRGATTDVDLNLNIGAPDAFAPVVMEMALGSSAASAFSAVSGPSGTQSALPWASDQVRVTFNEDVEVSADDLSIAGVNVLTYGLVPGPAGFHYDANTFTATWTLSTPIANDKVAITLSDDVKDIAGNALDGEASAPAPQGFAAFASTLGSGDGVPGGSFELRVDVLAGDVDGDGTVNMLDLLQVRDAMTLGNDRADVNRDGVVNRADLRFVSDQMFRLSTLPAGNPTIAPPPSSLPESNSPQAPAAVFATVPTPEEIATRAADRRRSEPVAAASQPASALARRRTSAEVVDTAISVALANGSETLGELRASRALRRVGRM
jgi:hypothetical protein